VIQLVSGIRPSGAAGEQLLVERSSTTEEEAGVARRLDSSEAINQHTIETMSRLIDDPGALGELLASFRDAAQERLTEMQAAVDGGDLPALRLLAHNLKGSSGTFGAEHLSELCARLEQIAIAGSGDDAQAWLDLAAAEFTRVRGELRRLYLVLEDA
jgi:HPt (histidine-containing phosphotransfer) domain-containing protein